MKKITLLLLITLCCQQLYAQLFSGSYDLGRFYTNDGKRVDGLVRFSEYLDYFYYKEGEKSDRVKYKSDDVKALVVVKTFKTVIKNTWKNREYETKTMVDSFVVKAIEKPNKKPYFAKAICEPCKIKLYHKILPPRGGSPTMSIGAAPNMGSTGSQPAFHNTYSWSNGSSYPGGYETYYEKDDVTFELTKSNYKAILAEAFADVPPVVSMIDGTKFKDIEKLIQAYLNAKKKIIG